MPSPNAELDQLQAVAIDVLARAKKAGATQAELGINLDRGLNVNVRMGEVETLEHTSDRGLSLTVYVGKHKGSASTADLSERSIAATIDQAIAIAKFTQADECAGLADPALLAKHIGDLDQWHPWAISAEQAIEMALACESAGLQFDPRISNSDGAGVGTSRSLSLYATSDGFIGREFSTAHSISCSLLAGKEADMERDYDYDSHVDASAMRSPADIGINAAKRTLARLDPQTLSTRQTPVLFAAEVARGLFGHLLGAISGGSQYRKASFLLGAAGEQIFPNWMQLVEHPHLPRFGGSSYFDDEGVATKNAALIADGVLQHYLLGSYSARKLGLSSTGNAGGVRNLAVKANASNFADMLQRLGTGLLVTELMGQGVNGVTGDYSRGAAGFWVENGKLAFPVSEITIAGNLRTMYQNISAVGNDVDLRGNVQCGSVLIDQMTLAG